MTKNSPTAHHRRLGPVVLAAFLIGACAGERRDTSAPEALSTSTVRPGATGPSSTIAGAPITARFVPGQCPIDTTSMVVAVDCGTVEVAQDRTDPGSGGVTLAVMVVKAGAQSSATPVVYLPGGPGDSAVSTIADLATDPEAVGVFAGRDWIVFDPRGTGFSSPTVACPVTDGLADAEQVAAAGRCAARLTADGVDLTEYNTATLAADAIDVRNALAIDRWNVFGVSYGTRVALELMRNDRGAIHAAVLDGVYPPTQGFNDSLDERPTAAFRQLFADCVAQVACATAFPDLDARVVAMIDRLNAAPVEVSGFTFTGDFVVVVAARAMYHYSPGEDEIHTIPYALSSAADGDFAALVRLAVLNFSDEPGSAGGAQADTTVGMGRAVQCHDEIPFLDRDLADRQSREYPFGAAFGRFDGNIEFDICAVFNAGMADPSFREAVVSDVPTMMFTGTYDPTTPSRWADEAASTLTAAQVVRFAGVGHVVINTGACPVTLMHSFFAEPEVPVDLTCVDDYSSPEFDLVAP